jgi:hypothetical protein
MAAAPNQIGHRSVQIATSETRIAKLRSADRMLRDRLNYEISRRGSYTPHGDKPTSHYLS